MGYNMTLIRRDDWLQRLTKWATDEQGKPFAWGETNCVALALRAIDVQLDAPFFMPTYSRFFRSEVRSRAWLKTHTIHDFVELFVAAGGKVLNCAGVGDGDIMLLQRGDNLYAHAMVSEHWLSSSPSHKVRFYHRDAIRAITDDVVYYLGVR